MLEAFVRVQEFIKVKKKITRQEMASTVSAMRLIKEGENRFAVLGNVGDSPIYRLRDGVLEELTHYHDELPTQKDRQALGKSLPFKPNIWSVPIKDGDRFLVSRHVIIRPTFLFEV